MKMEAVRELSRKQFELYTKGCQKMKGKCNSGLSLGGLGNGWIGRGHRTSKQGAQGTVASTWRKAEEGTPVSAGVFLVRPPGRACLSWGGNTRHRVTESEDLAESDQRD